MWPKLLLFGRCLRNSVAIKVEFVFFICMHMFIELDIGGHLHMSLNKCVAQFSSLKKAPDLWYENLFVCVRVIRRNSRVSHLNLWHKLTSTYTLSYICNLKVNKRREASFSFSFTLLFVMYFVFWLARFWSSKATNRHLHGERRIEYEDRIFVVLLLNLFYSSERVPLFLATIDMFSLRPQKGTLVWLTDSFIY